MTTEERDFLESLAIGAACKALPVRKKLPIAYSYNGVILPKLPEWDREMYPYAYIGNWSDYLPMLVLSPDILDCNPNSAIVPGDPITDGFNQYKLSDGVWVPHDYIMGEIPLIWCNVDVHYNEYSGELAGTLYLAASDPIPVYE